MAYDPLAVEYRKSPARAVASFDFFDIAEGSGIIEFYGARMPIDNTPGNDEYILTTNSTLVSANGGGKES